MLLNKVTDKMHVHKNKAPYGAHPCSHLLPQAAVSVLQPAHSACVQTLAS